MTKKQRKQIIEMRTKGVGYLAIAHMIGLSRDIVRGFCKKKNMLGYGNVTALNIKEQAAKGNLCRNCLLPIKRKHTGRPKKFCSDKCRYEYHNNERREERNGKLNGVENDSG